MSNFIRITHDMDNYEELVDVDEIIFVRVCWILPAGDSKKDWDGKAELVFKNGLKETVRFAEEGWDKFVEKLSMETND